jgi:[acyl-carrier-protein] S-malonyltransferase
MSVASHCELLTAAVENLKPYLEEYLKDEFSPVISNVTTHSYTTKGDAIELLSSQLTSPVKYKQSILSHSTVDAFIEFGNGAVLKGLNRKINKAIPTLNVSDFASLEKTIEALND